MSFDIKTPTDLYEVKRYEDAEAGTILEMIPLDPTVGRAYVGEVIVNGQHKIVFALSGATSLPEAQARWESALSKTLENIQARQEAAQQEAKRERLRAQIMSATRPNGHL